MTNPLIDKYNEIYGKKEKPKFPRIEDYEGEELKWQYYTHDYSCDVVGTIYNDDGVYNEETGEPITPPTAMEGFHVNYIGAYPEEFEQYVVTPATPYRKFAGH